MPSIYTANLKNHTFKKKRKKEKTIFDLNFKKTFMKKLVVYH
jgi:hypothetical protein